MEDYGTPGATTLLMVNYGIGKVTTEFLVFPDGGDGLRTSRKPLRTLNTSCQILSLFSWTKMHYSGWRQMPPDMPLEKYSPSCVTTTNGTQ